MALTINRLNGNNKSKDRDYDVLEYYYLHTDIYTLLYSNMVLLSA